LSQDARLAKIVAARPGLRVSGALDGFELAAGAVLGQQFTVFDAPVLAKRLAGVFGRPVHPSFAGLRYVFPQVENLAEANLEIIGIPADHAGTNRRLAQAVLAGKLDFNSRNGLHSMLLWLRSHPGLG